MTSQDISGATISPGVKLSRKQFILLLLLYGFLSISLTLGFKYTFQLIPQFPLFFMALLLTIEAVIIHIAHRISMCIQITRSEERLDLQNHDLALSSRFYLAAIGLCVAGEIGLSNLGLMRLSVASHTMIKASTPLFVLCASLMLGLEKPSLGIFLIVLLISAGTTLCSLGRMRQQPSAVGPVSWADEFSFEFKHVVGVALTVAAGMTGGLRWGFTQLLTQEHGTRPRHLILRTLPISAASLVVVSAVLEGQTIAASIQAKARMVVTYALFLSLMGLILLWCEVTLVATTSSLSLAIIATIKELGLLFVSVVYLQDYISQLGMGGFFITTVGIMSYNLHKLDAYHAGSTQPTLYSSVAQEDACELTNSTALATIDEETVEDVKEDDREACQCAENAEITNLLRQEHTCTDNAPVGSDYSSNNPSDCDATTLCAGSISAKESLGQL